MCQNVTKMNFQSTLGVLHRKWSNWVHFTGFIWNAGLSLQNGKGCQVCFFGNMVHYPMDLVHGPSPCTDNGVPGVAPRFSLFSLLRHGFSPRGLGVRAEALGALTGNRLWRKMAVLRCLRWVMAWSVRSWSSFRWGSYKEWRMVVGEGAVWRGWFSEHILYSQGVHGRQSWNGIGWWRMWFNDVLLPLIAASWGAQTNATGVGSLVWWRSLLLT
jgi:hypothetical protein